MSSRKKIAERLAEAIKAAARDDGNNVASAVNVGGSGRRISVKSSKRVVQRDGVTTVIEEREERSGQ